MVGMLLDENEHYHIIGSTHITGELGTQLQFSSSSIHAVLPTAQRTGIQPKYITTPARSPNQVQVNERTKKDL